MSADAARQAEQLFLELAGAGAKTRAGLLDERCANDPALRAEVEALLGFHDGAGEFLEQPPSQTLGGFHAVHTQSHTLPPGARIGSFTLERVLGEGGMGVVYVARQERPNRTVALKVIRRGYGTPSLIRRFEHEAEVLGRLQHPGIAQIFEAGSAPVAGQEQRGEHPYIAMELVDGQPLTTAGAALDTRARMELFARVCEAVHHAHQRGIIHRDLKPANILVDARGQPKVLDFGVARATDADLRVTTMQTGIGQLIGTLPYMSPEQVLADPSEVDTRSDVYALGVILYQSLTGRLPLDLSSRSIPEAAKLIRDQPPSRLSSVSRVFRGDIDVIVRKALEKDKARRYQSAAELGEDIERYLRGDPIAARQDSGLYIVRRQLRRYRGAAIASSVILLLLAAFSVYAGVQSERNRHLAARLAEELSLANIERGRLMAVGGNIIGAEDMIWPELLAHPDSNVARWSLRELYSASPIVATVPGHEYRYTPPLPTPGGRSVVLARADGVVEVRSPDLTTLIGETAPLPGVLSALALSPDGARIVAGNEDGALTWIDAGSRALVRTQPLHTGPILSAAFSPDGALLATAGADKSVLLTSAPTGALVDRLTGATDRILAIAFNPSGKTIIAASRASALHLWDTGAPASLRAILLPGPPSAMAVLSEHEVLVATADRLCIVSTQPAVPTRFLPTALTNIRSLSADIRRRLLVVAGEGSLEVWDLAAEKRLSSLAAAWPGSFVAAGVFAEGAGGLCIAIGGAAPSARAWELSPRAFERSWPGSAGWMVGGVFTDQAIITTSSFPVAEVVQWDPATGAKARTLYSAHQTLRGGVLSPDGRSLAVLSMNTGVTVVDLEGGVTHELPFAGCRCVAFTGDGKYLVAGAGGTLRVWGAGDDAGAPPRDIPIDSLEVINVAGRPASSQVVTVGGKPGVTVVDVSTGRIVSQCEGLPQGIHACYSRDGALIAVPAKGRELAVRDSQTLALKVTLAGNRDVLIRSDFSPDGSMIATGSFDGTVRLWETATGRLLATVLDCGAQVSVLAFSPDGSRLLASGQDHQIRVLDLKHYDRHIAGNLPFQAQRQASRQGDRPDTSRLETWAKGVLKR